ncbi:hypothetical protein HCH_03472 [Hahella chejuensis KCTC 2396]|uniref:Uncharacterized protein n=1 Tax=Hahella chejuensis (strain KCTC 2396) TaxID=349521 RepID=Q2SGK5_HAHCH|nr:hypothetical protein HCH_03472 [Hahella chejuensis KCTC 2396]
MAGKIRQAERYSKGLEIPPLIGALELAATDKEVGLLVDRNPAELRRAVLQYRLMDSFLEYSYFERILCIYLYSFDTGQRP